MLAVRQDFQEALDGEDSGDAVVAMAPVTSADLATDSRVDAVARALGDSSDLKPRPARRRARRRVAEGIGGYLGAGVDRHLRRAAFVHDIGKCPPDSLNKGARSAEAGREQFRRHTYYSERHSRSHAGHAWRS